jgi:hypothetical protein
MLIQSGGKNVKPDHQSLELGWIEFVSTFHLSRLVVLFAFLARMVSKELLIHSSFVYVNQSHKFDKSQIFLMYLKSHIRPCSLLEQHLMEFGFIQFLART